MNNASRSLNTHPMNDTLRPQDSPTSPCRWRRRVAVAGVFGVVALLAGCGSNDPTGSGSTNTDATAADSAAAGSTSDSASTEADTGSGTAPAADTKSTKLVIGSQAYYSNEIIAEIYAESLEAGGYKVDRQFQIGQREVYLPEITKGKIDVFPEYIGSLLQALDKSAAGGTPDEVYNSLKKALPSGLTALSPSDASDQNSWTVTRAFADKFNLTDIASLKNVNEPIIVGGNSELETRPYGPKALADRYGVKTSGFKAVEDSGGPLTVKALASGAIQLANIYTADPNISTNNLVALNDPDGLFLPDNIVPIVSGKVDAKAKGILDQVSARLTQEDLVNLNAKAVNDKASLRTVASEWLKKTGN
jgi:osmoprotectant transport system substrate-binding protein